MSDGGGIEQRLAALRIVVFDVDGVLTDGSVSVDAQGGETLRFDVQDGLGIVRGRQVGLEFAIISGREAPAVTARARRLGIEHVQQGQFDKSEAIARVLADLAVDLSAVAFMGDDLNDLPAMERVGVVCAPSNARPEVKEVADLVTVAAGGRGAVREFLERIIAAKGRTGAP
ncbi:MAG TPA: HAD hydrolase family protein [Acidimicrobiia bacterium]|nr:HAD hydrolase family protein [Acidimicrobiia bacterium]